MKPILTVLLFMGVVAAAFASSRQQDVMVFHYPPYMIEGSKGKAMGLEVDILEAALAKTVLKLNYRFYPIARATELIRYSALNDHPIYLGSSLHFTEDIERGKVYAVCIGRAQFVAYTFANSPIAKIKNLTIEKLKPYRLAVLRGSTIKKPLAQAGINPLEARTFEQFFLVLDRGKVDASIVLDIAGDAELKSRKAKGKKKVVKIDRPLFEIPLAIVISRDHPQSTKLYEKLQARLTEMRKSGELKAIAEKYYGVGQVPDGYFCE